jgi:hypothetical protein
MRHRLRGHSVEIIYRIGLAIIMVVGGGGTFLLFLAAANNDGIPYAFPVILGGLSFGAWTLWNWIMAPARSRS